MLSPHSPTGEHYDQAKDRWQAWCDDCGQELHAFETWVKGYGPYLIGWFHEESDFSGKVSKESVCRLDRYDAEE